MDKIIFQLEFDKDDNSKKYKIKKIFDNIVHANNSKNSNLSDFYYLVLQINYTKKNT